METRALCKYDAELFLLDTDASNFVDGKSYQITGLFFVDGTSSYQTVAGAKKTVPLIKPIPARASGEKNAK